MKRIFIKNVYKKVFWLQRQARLTVHDFQNWRQGLELLSKWLITFKTNQFILGYLYNDFITLQNWRQGLELLSKWLITFKTNQFILGYLYNDYITLPSLINKTYIAFSYTSYLYQHSTDFRMNVTENRCKWMQRFESAFVFIYST